MRLLYSKIFTFFLLISLSTSVKSQCIVASSCGYTVNVKITPKTIAPSTLTCTSGYNYNVGFTYSITVTGVNTCYNGNIGIQPQIICGGQNNGYYTINVAAPVVGAASTTKTYTGSLTTSSNSYRSTNDCATATPSLLGCSNIQTTIFGPGISTTTLTCAAGGALAITLNEFTAKMQNSKTILNWSTSLEINNKLFIIEHSTDGINFTEKGNVSGSLNSTSTKQYSYVDNSPVNGKNYYRLKSIDINGNFSYSKIISSTNDVKTSNIFINTNLTSGIFYVTTNFSDDIFLLSTSGQIIQKLVKGKNNITSLPAGMYLIKMNTDVLKIVKY